jgi:hypothetical protein
MINDDDDDDDVTPLPPFYAQLGALRWLPQCRVAEQR